MQTFNINCEKFPLYRTLAIIHLNIKKKKKNNSQNGNIWIKLAGRNEPKNTSLEKSIAKVSDVHQTCI